MPLVRGRLLLEKLLPHFESLLLCRKRHRGAMSHLRFPPPNSPSPRSSCASAPFPPARVPGREPERVGSEPAPGVRGGRRPRPARLDAFTLRFRKRSSSPYALNVTS